MDRILDFPACTLRFISGHTACTTTRTEAALYSEGNRLWPRMNWDPTPLYLLCLILKASTYFATACFDRTFPAGNPKKFNRNKYFASSHVGLSSVFDVNDSTWPFRIGFEDQDDNDENESDWIFMSVPIRDLVTCGSKTTSCRARGRQSSRILAQKIQLGQEIILRTKCGHTTSIRK